MCAGKLTPPRPQDGDKNGNWKGGRASHPAVYVRAFKIANPDKVRAHIAVAAALRHGTLTRPTQCSSCLRECHPDAHHADYQRVLVVEWLCRKCHRAADKRRAAQDALKPRAATTKKAQRDADISHQDIDRLAGTPQEVSGRRFFAAGSRHSGTVAQFAFGRPRKTVAKPVDGGSR